MSARRPDDSPRRSLPASGAGSAPGPSRGTSSTVAMTARAIPAGSAVSHSDRSGPRTPVASRRPSAATATKFTEDLMRKNATDRRAMRSAAMPPWRSTQAPSARPLAPLAGTSEPTASSDQPICQLRSHGMRRQKTGRKSRTYDTQLSASSTTASTSQPGAARVRVSRSSPSPGASRRTSPMTAPTASSAAARRCRRCGLSSDGIGAVAAAMAPLIVARSTCSGWTKTTDGGRPRRRDVGATRRRGARRPPAASSAAAPPPPPRAHAACAWPGARAAAG